MSKVHFIFPDNDTYCGEGKKDGDVYVQNTHDAAATAIASREDMCGICYCIWLSIEQERLGRIKD